MDNENKQFYQYVQKICIDKKSRRTKSSNISFFVTFTYDEFAVYSSHNIIIFNICNSTLSVTTCIEKEKIPELKPIGMNDDEESLHIYSNELSKE